MIFLGNLTKITDIKYAIGFVHYMPFDSVNGLHKTQEQLEQEGVFVNSSPTPDSTIVAQNKEATLYWNPIDKVLFYEYTDIPKTQEQLLQDRLNSVEIAIANMVGV